MTWVTIKHDIYHVLKQKSPPNFSGGLILAAMFFVQHKGYSTFPKNSLNSSFISFTAAVKEFILSAVSKFSLRK